MSGVNNRVCIVKGIPKVDLDKKDKFIEVFTTRVIKPL
jgi:hypothetical protein